MQKYKKRLIALFCAAVLLLTLTPPIRAASATVTAGSASVSAGGTVTVYVTAAQLEALASLELELHYDSSAFTLKSCVAAGMDYADTNTATAGVILYSGVSAAGLSGTARLLTLTFAAKPDAAPGGYPLTVAVGDAYDVSLTAAALSGVAGALTVTEPLETTPRISFYGRCSSSAVSQGDTLTWTIYAYDVKSLAGGDFLFTYDSAQFELVDFELLGAMQTGTAIFSVNDDSPGRVLVSYASSTAVGSGDLLRLTLRAAADVDAAATLRFAATSLNAADLSQIADGSSTASVTLRKQTTVPDYPDLRLEVPALTATDQPFEVVVSLASGSNVAAGDFVLRYDAALLECLSAEVHAEVAGSGCLVVTSDKYLDENGAGRIKFSVVHADGLAEEQALLTLRLAARENAAASTTITPSGTGVVSADGQAVTLDYVPAPLSIVVRSFTVTFKDSDGTVLETQAVPYLSAAAAPTPGGIAPTAALHYVFAGWDTAVDSITEDTVATATYTEAAHLWGTWTADPTDSARHIRTCTVCGLSETAGHSWVDNVCADCGRPGITTVGTATLVEHLDFVPEGERVLDLSADPIPAQQTVTLTAAVLDSLAADARPLTIAAGAGRIVIDAAAQTELSALDADVTLTITVDGMMLTLGLGTESGPVSLAGGGLVVSLPAAESPCLVYTQREGAAAKALPFARQGDALTLTLPLDTPLVRAPVSVVGTTDAPTISFAAVPSGLCVIAAAYDGAGRMLSCRVVVAPETPRWSPALPAEAETVCFYCFDATNMPLCEKIVTSPL